MGFDMGFIDEEMLASWGKESEMNEKLADPANKGNFKMVDPRDIQPFREHTFQVRDDEEMKELRDSIRANGILQPLLVYWNEEWELEMISGHRRRQAAIDLRLKEVPVIVMHVNRETATLLMGESNLRTRDPAGCKLSGSNQRVTGEEPRSERTTDSEVYQHYETDPGTS